MPQLEFAETPKSWPLLPSSLFEAFDTDNGIFIGEVLVCDAKECERDVGVAAEVDFSSLQLLAAFEGQSRALQCVRRACAEGLVQRCALYRLALPSRSLLRVWYDRRRDVGVLKGAAAEAAAALCEAFGRATEWHKPPSL